MDDNKIAPESEPQDQAYQDILNQYSQELGTNTIETPNEATNHTEPVSSEPVEPVEVPPVVSQPIDPALVAPMQDVTPPPPPAPVAPPVVTPPPPPPPKAEMTQYSTPPPSQPGIFKILFIISFLIFLGVAGALGWTVYKLNQIKSQKLPSLPLTENLTPTAPLSTPTPLIGCELNDKRYSVAETFPAADGCNTCTCNESLTIDCTQKECTVTPTATSTTSAVPADWKTYTNNTYGFSLKYPKDWATDTKIENQSDIVGFKDNDNLTASNNIFISYFINPKKLSIPDYYKDYTSNSDMVVSNPFTSNPPPTSINIGGTTGYRFGMQGPLAKDVVAFLLPDKKILTINRLIEQSSRDVSVKVVFDQILSTFKFTTK